MTPESTTRASPAGGPPPVRPPAAPPWGSTADAVLKAVGSDPRAGLTEEEARERLRAHGRNELAREPPVPRWRKFLAQFSNVLVILLVIATAISAALWYFERETALPYEAMVIFAVVLLNAVIGYIQEQRAETAVAALRRMTAAHASVIRGGEPRSIEAADLVPGDILRIEEGDTIAADARLLQSSALRTNEAVLTGESVPVSKDVAPVAPDASVGERANMVFSGTAAIFGRATAVVTATGMQTEIGRIAGMLSRTPEEATPLQKELDRVGKLLGLVVVVIAVVMIGTIILVEHVREVSALVDVMILGVALAVAAVPEGLPAVVTAVLAVGVQRMARRNAIVRHLAAVETLGSATVIASDKTGTLTRNEMTVRRVVTASGVVEFSGTGYAPEGEAATREGGRVEGPLLTELRHALAVADRANNASLRREDDRWIVHGDPTEGALITAALKAGLDPERLGERLARVGEIPFSSERKLMSTIHSDAAEGERLLVFTKGAPDVLLGRCDREQVGSEVRPLTEARRAAILAAAEELAGDALRTLGVAARELPPDALERHPADESFEQGLVFLGLIGMIDPPREEARPAVERARAAGIRPIMITGDHPRTAAVIAAELGIAENRRAATGKDIDQQSDEELAETLRETSVFARVNPEHKMRIVRALRRRGHIVAMTGDGVNDAPALKSADIGVAMGITGTDVSREAADIVLTDDNFATIVAAVEEGRAIFANIRKFLRYLLSSNIGEVMTMFFGVLLAHWIGLRSETDAVVLPLLATHILWINLVTDGPPALALGVDPPDPGLMQVPPRPAHEGVLTRRMWKWILLVGAVMAAGTLLVLDAAMPGGLIEGHGDLRRGQTMAFTTLMLFQLFNVLNSRSDEHSAFRGLFTNHWLWLALGVSVLLHVAIIHTPFLQRAFSTVSLSPAEWGICVAVASSVLWLRELTKWIAHRGAWSLVLVLTACLTLPPRGMAADPAADAGSFRIEHAQWVPGAGFAVTLSPGEGDYVAVDHSDRAPGPFHTLAVRLRSDGAAMTVLVSPDNPSRVGFVRARSIPGNAPEDSDGDGIDDVYELLRSHVMDPLSPADALEDADGDGLTNLEEYLNGTESAPPAPGAPNRYASLAELRAAPPYPLRDPLYLEGHTSPGDGWEGWFRWEPDSTASADGAIVAEVHPGRIGRLTRLIEASAPVNAGWWLPDRTGTSNAAPTLQKAFDFMVESGRHALVIPPGRYRIEAQVAGNDPARAALRLVSARDFEISGPGATLFSETPGELLMIHACRDGVIRDLAFEGSGSDPARQNDNYAVIQLIGENTRLQFIRLRLTAFMHGISHLHGRKVSTHVTIRDCHFEDGGDTHHAQLGIDGAAISGIGNHWTIENNLIRECARGIEIENVSRTDPITGVMIRGNRILDIRNLGIMAFMGGVSPDTIQQRNNHIVDNLLVAKRPHHRYADGSPIPVMGMSLNGGYGWIISGNTCMRGDYAGISLYATQAPGGHSLVSDNLVEDFGGRGIQVLSSADHRMTGVSVVGNRIRNCNDRGLLVAGDDILVSENSIVNAAVAGIMVGVPERPSGEMTVIGNSIRAPFNGAPAISVVEENATVILAGNRIFDAAVGIRHSSTNVSLANNIFVRVTSEQEEAAAAAPR